MMGRRGARPRLLVPRLPRLLVPVLLLHPQFPNRRRHYSASRSVASPPSGDAADRAVGVASSYGWKLRLAALAASKVITTAPSTSPSPRREMRCPNRPRPCSASLSRVWRRCGAVVERTGSIVCSNLTAPVVISGAFCCGRRRSTLASREVPAKATNWRRFIRCAFYP